MLRACKKILQIVVCVAGANGGRIGEAIKKGGKRGGPEKLRKNACYNPPPPPPTHTHPFLLISAAAGGLKIPID